MSKYNVCQNIKIGDYWEGTYTFFSINSETGEITSFPNIKSKFLIVDLKRSDTDSKIVSLKFTTEGFPEQDEIIYGILNEKYRYLKIAEGNKVDPNFSFTNNHLDKYNNLTLDYLDTNYGSYSKRFKFYSS